MPEIKTKQFKVKEQVMKRFLMLAAVVAGVSLTGLTGMTGSAEAGYGYPSRVVPVAPTNYHGGFGGYNGYGGANRGCWGGYRNIPVRNVHRPLPYNYGNKCGTGYSSGYFGGSRWNW